MENIGRINSKQTNKPGISKQQLQIHLLR